MAELAPFATAQVRRRKTGGAVALWVCRCFGATTQERHKAAAAVGPGRNKRIWALTPKEPPGSLHFRAVRPMLE